MADERARRKYLLALLGVFSVVAIWAAIAPVDRKTWVLENALVALALPVLVVTYRKLPFSLVSYALITIFLCLHEIGAHYTYAQTPIGAWLDPLFGGEAHPERNHYDRVVHFCYGLLLAYPLREVVLRVADMKGFWGYFIPLDVTMSTSMLYELIEWVSVLVFGGESGMAFLATQGDEWDSHKDMLLASAGALIAMIVTALVNWRMQRDFAREWNASLKVRHPRPLGEETMARRKRRG